MLTRAQLFVFIRTETLKVEEVRFVVDLVELQRHFGIPPVDRVLTAYSHMERIDRFPFLK